MVQKQNYRETGRERERWKDQQSKMETRVLCNILTTFLWAWNFIKIKVTKIRQMKENRGCPPLHPLLSQIPLFTPPFTVYWAPAVPWSHYALCGLYTTTQNVWTPFHLGNSYSFFQIHGRYSVLCGTFPGGPQTTSLALSAPPIAHSVHSSVTVLATLSYCPSPPLNSEGFLLLSFKPPVSHKKGKLSKNDELMVE